jgi:arabinan endo-1,5-alpha-L-arabinosidase
MDPAIVESSGASHLVFGSHAGGVFLAELDPASGRLKERPEETRTSEGSERFVLLASNPLTEEDSLGGIEAPYIHERDGRFHLFVNVGACCRGVDSTYRVLSGRADVVTGPYLDRDGVDMKDGGGTVFLDGGGRLLGPGHVGIGSDGAGDVVTYHYYDGDDDGISKLGARALNWTSDGWPEPGEARIGP